MRVAIVFHKNPCAHPVGIDLVRLRAIAQGLIKRGVETEIVSPVEGDRVLDGSIPVRPLPALREPARYDLVKTSYHDSIMLVEDFAGPIVSRIVRVVDERLPKRDEQVRKKLLRCQSLIRSRSSAVVLNNEENRERWHKMYGDSQLTRIIPTGCPAVLPDAGGNPYPPGPPPILFLGSVAAPRMVHMLNAAARQLRGSATVHLVGRNKAQMYGGDRDCMLDPLIMDHGEKVEDEVWPFIMHAAVGLALATGTDPFDNDVSKIFSYLRGGLPVVSEHPIVNNWLVDQTRMGRVFGHGMITELVASVHSLLDRPPEPQTRMAAMQFMAEHHSWDRRVESYMELFSLVLANGAGRG